MIRRFIWAVLFAGLFSGPFMAGCATSDPDAGELPYQGPLVRDNGDLVEPPSLEVAP